MQTLTNPSGSWSWIGSGLTDQTIPFSAGHPFTGNGVCFHSGDGPTSPRFETFKTSTATDVNIAAQSGNQVQSLHWNGATPYADLTRNYGAVVGSSITNIPTVNILIVLAAGNNAKAGALIVSWTRIRKYANPDTTFGASGQSEGIEIIDMRRHYRYRIRLK